MIENTDFILDEKYGQRLLISIKADQTELEDNIRVARVLLSERSSLNLCYKSKGFAPSDDILTLQRYKLILKFPNI